MNDFHKDQCQAAEGIKEQFSAKDAARYLIGEKLLRFMEASHEHSEFADELPKFVAEIKRIFDPHEIAEFFDDLAAGAVPDPVKIFRGDIDEDALEERDVQYDAEKLLLVENAKVLLLG